MQRKASGVWKGGLKDGKGTVSSTSGVLANTPYSFTTRFENAPGTNPEELIAAAHAACFSMALSAQLGNANITPEASTPARPSPWTNWIRAGPSPRFISMSPRAFQMAMPQPSRPQPIMRKADVRFRKC